MKLVEFIMLFIWDSYIEIKLSVKNSLPIINYERGDNTGGEGEKRKLKSGTKMEGGEETSPQDNT